MFLRHQTTDISYKGRLAAVYKPLLILLTGFLCFLLSGSLLSSVAFAYEEAVEQAAVKASLETFLRSYAEEAMLYNDSDQTVCSVSSPYIMQAQENSEQTFHIGKKDLTIAELQKNITFVEKKALFYSAMRQMQNIHRENLQFRYRYPVFELGESVCHVSLTEIASFCYTDCDRPSVLETNYSIDLVKLGGQWLVADITDGSRFDTLYKNDPDFDLSAALAELEVNLHTESCHISYPYDSEAEIPGGGHLLYQGMNAAAYAYTYSRQNVDALRVDFYSPLFHSYAGQGGDCMNFVSQCMWAGFYGSQEQAAIEASSLPMDTDGDSKWEKWYSDGVSTNGEPSLPWVSCQSFRKYLTGESDGTGTAGSNTAGDMGMYATILDIGPGSPLSGVEAASLIGAPAHVEGAGGAYAHAIILTDAVGTNRNEIWFCSHTKDMTHIKLGDYYFGPMKVYIPRYMRLNAPPAVSIQPMDFQPVKVSALSAVGFHTNEVSAKLRLVITPPGGEAGQPVFTENSNTCSTEYHFTEAGLYRIDCYAAVSEMAEEQSAVFYIRCYDPPEHTRSLQETPSAEAEPAEPDPPDSVPPDWLLT